MKKLVLLIFEVPINHFIFFILNIYVLEGQY